MKSMESDYKTKNKWAKHGDRGYYFSLSVQRRWVQTREWAVGRSHGDICG